ncbi:MAG: HNH endonuclease [Anaerolineaceae bacterium]|nr:HNH endonuclease [Anaerolineaceae bacterium]
MDRRGARSVFVRALEKIRIVPGDCWEWAGTLNNAGYGIFRIAKENRNVLAHRYMLSLALGRDIPSDTDVCHVCDNPKCVNPEHLYLGNAYTNMHDMIAKRRDNKARGRNVHGVKLNEAEVREARRLYSEGGWKIQAIADLFGISRNGMAAVVKRESWKWLK